MWKRTILLLALAWTADAQIINTVAGGGPVGGANFGLIQPSDVVVDSAGNFYVALPDSCQVWVLNASGVITRVIGNGICGYSGDGGPAAAASLNGPHAVAVDRFGVLYIAEAKRIRMVSGGTITTLVAVVGCPLGLAFDSSANLYIADDCAGQVMKVVPGGLTTIVAGNGTIAYNGDNISATSAGLTPQAVAVDSAGNIYIADTYNNRIRKVSGGTITTVAGTGTGGYNGDNFIATAAELQGPAAVAVDDSGDLYIADTGNARIRRVSGGIITTLANSLMAGGISISGGSVYVADTSHNRIGTVTNSGFTPLANTGLPYGADGITATMLSLGAPAAVAVDDAGNLFIADAGCVVWKVAAGTKIISTAAGTGVCGYNGDNISAVSAQLNHPAGLAVDNAGGLFISDSYNHRVRKVVGGIITTVAGNGVAGFTGDNMSATSAELSYPMGIALDRSGNLYIADYDNYRIWKVSGGIISTVAGNGVNGFSEPNTNTNPLSPIKAPASVAVDGLGTLYFAEVDNSIIRKVSGGVLSTVPFAYFGNFDADLVPYSTRPIGLAVDNAGTLYYSDPDNAVIRKVAGGTVTTVIGTGSPGFSGDGGPAILATVNEPTGLAVDSNGSIYFADSLNNRVRESVLPPSLSPRVVIDSPLAGALVSGVITVSGWAINQLSGGAPISSMQVQVNGTFVGNAVYGISRPDVCANYPGRPNCPNVGFSFSLNTAPLANTGPVSITVSATDSNGIAGLGITSVGISVVNPPPVPNCVGMFSSPSSPFQSEVCSGINQGVFQGNTAVTIGAPATYYGAMTLVGNVPFGNAPGMALYNAGGGAGASVSLDLYNTPANGGIPQAKIKAIDDGNYSDHLTFWTKIPGGPGNAVTEKVRITSTGNVGIGTTNPTRGPLQMGSGAYVTAGGVWTNASDRKLKENFVPVTPAAILQKIDTLPLLEWNYRNEDSSVRHIGPVAQDFYSIFGVGNSATSISTIDPSGIALAGIQGLDQKSRGRAFQLDELKERLGAKTEELRILRERLARLESLFEQTGSESNRR